MAVAPGRAGVARTNPREEPPMVEDKAMPALGNVIWIDDERIEDHSAGSYAAPSRRR
jgi:hypothetical protein